MRRALPLLPLLFVLAFLAASPAAPGAGCQSPCNGLSVNPPGTSLLAVRPWGDAGPLVAYDTVTQARRYELPDGRGTADGRAHFAARPRKRSSVLRRYDTRTGRLSASWTVAGRWWLSGVSAGGRWLTLTAVRQRPGSTRLAVVDTRTRRIERQIRLRGQFDVETVSADGRRLFLIEHLGRRWDRYAIRLFDLRHGRLRQGTLDAEKNRIMIGYAWSSIGTPDGRWLLTLYLDTEKRAAFVHALDLVHAKPVCIPLPSTRTGSGFAPRDAADFLMRYSLTLAPGGRLLAANPALGALAEIDLRRLAVVRTVRFPAGRGAPLRSLPQTTNGALSRDSRTLYFNGVRALWAYDRAAARVRGPYRVGAHVIGLAFGAANRNVYALRADNRLLGFDAATGRRLDR